MPIVRTFRLSVGHHQMSWYAGTTSPWPKAMPKRTFSVS